MRLGVVVSLALFCLSACTEVRESPAKEVEYHAYDKTWRYTAVERYTKSWGFDTPHGIIGMCERLEQFVHIVTEEGEKIPVHERIYALQKDGSYRKVECCNKVRIQVAVYNFDKKLMLYFRQTRENTTDCFVYPAGYPDDEKEPDPMKKKLYVTLFGEFDPQTKRFNVSNFLPGFTHEEFMEKVGYRASIEQTHAFFYTKRRPFICER